MEFRAIKESDYAKLLELDKKVYPTDNPVTPEILDKWYQRNPEFGMIFEKNGSLEGMLIAIPLNKSGWERLISGDLQEADLDSETIFDGSRDNEIGIHVYHIEKFGTDKKFYEKSLSSLYDLVKDFDVVGFSGLCVTSQGIGLFYNKFNCRERDFINSEHILSKEGKLEIFDTKSKEELLNKLDGGYDYLNRCKMLVVYPNEPSLVWKFLKD